MSMTPQDGERIGRWLAAGIIAATLLAEVLALSMTDEERRRRQQKQDAYYQWCHARIASAADSEHRRRMWEQTPMDDRHDPQVPPQGTPVETPVPVTVPVLTPAAFTRYEQDALDVLRMQHQRRIAKERRPLEYAKYLYDKGIISEFD